VIPGRTLYAGLPETFRKVITEGEASLFAMIGIIGGFLHNRVAGTDSQCISCQFEFLAPITTGDRIDTVIVLDHHDVEKQLATYKIDCYNQDRDQVITGQAVMLVPPE
jgi:acyl dehydratase